MIHRSPSTLRARLVPDVANFEYGSLVLGRDLTELVKAHDAELYTATALYCGRILEALTGAAAQRAGFEVGDTVADNMSVLQLYDLLPKTIEYWSNALRRMGNTCRHLKGGVNPEDAEVLLLFLERWINWFFLDYEHGPRLPRVARDLHPLGLSVWSDLYQVIEALEASPTNPPPDVLDDLRRKLAVHQTPLLPAALAEILIGAGQLEDALQVLTDGLRHFPNDPRLCDLKGLYFSRGKQFDAALAWLEPHYQKSDADEETIGIMGGVYKRKWLQTRDDVWLQKCQEAYGRGWELSGKNNTYLGINVAALLFWRDQHAECRKVARRVCKVLRDRAKALQNPARQLPFNYWDQVTLAEANFFLGNMSDARTGYNQAFKKFEKERASDIKSSRDQLAKNLTYLDPAALVDQYLAVPIAPAAAPFRVGFTSEFDGPADPQLAKAVQGALAGAVPQAGHPVVLCTAATPNEQAVARDALGQNGGLRVVVPLELTEYCEGFAEDKASEEFRHLLVRADAVVFPEELVLSEAGKGALKKALKQAALPGDSRERSLKLARFYIAEQCDVLLALWSGMPPLGPGDSDLVAAHALAAGKQVVWVSTQSPYPVLPQVGKRS